MALTEETVQDKIEVVQPHSMVQVRTATVIKRDGVEISRSFHAMSLHQMQTSQVKAQRCKPSVTQFTPKRSRMPTPHT